jgi:hypothetical protein
MFIDFDTDLKNCSEEEKNAFRAHIEKQDLRIREIRHQLLVTKIITTPVVWN